MKHKSHTLPQTGWSDSRHKVIKFPNKKEQKKRRDTINSLDPDEYARNILSGIGARINTGAVTGDMYDELGAAKKREM